MRDFMNPQAHILDFDRDSLASELEDKLQLEHFRARQLMPWVYKRGVTDFSAMTDIGNAARIKLNSHFEFTRPKPITCQLSTDGTRKYLFELEDGARVETVLIKQPTRYTLCVSSQVGCAMGCKFCRTALMGLKRNLKTSEIIGQVMAVRDDIQSRLEEEKIDFQNIVFMGMGEPLHNFNNVLRALHILTDNLGLNFAGRKITVSTSGLVPAIKRFSEAGMPASLAVSLNATTDEVRSRLIPINKRFPLETLLGTLREVQLDPRKKFTMEYVLLKGVNDTPEDIERLPKLLKGLSAKVNLIPYNNNSGLGFRSPEKHEIIKWHNALTDRGVSCTIRWSKGEDIDAACGQLASNTQ